MENTNYLKKELYELIKRDESIFDFIQDSSLDGLWYWDLEHPEEEWMNPKFWSVLGYDHRKMPHKSSAWQDIIHPDDLKLATENFVKHCEDSSHPYDQTVRYTHKNGSTVWIRCRGLVVRDELGKPLRMVGAHQDVTQLKNKELQLQQKTDQLRNAQHVSKIGSWEVNLITGEQIWSEELYRLYGCDPSLPLPSELDLGKRFSPESWAQLSAAKARAREQGTPYELELQTKAKDGRPQWLWIRGEAVLDEKNSIVGIRGVIQDISEKKQLELEKEASIKRLNYALDASGDGIWDWTPLDGVCVYSKAWVEMLGYQAGEIAPLASEWFERLHTDDADWVFAAINRVTDSPENGDSFSHEYRFRNKAGDYLWILNKAKIVERNERGQALRVVGTHTDITQHKKRELQITSISKEIKDITKAVNESSALSISNSQDILVKVNEQLCQLSGHTEEELLGKSSSVLRGDCHDAEFWQKQKEVIESGKTWKGEIQQRRKNGSTYWVNCVVQPTVDETGNIEQYITIAQDITDRKQTELTLLESEKKFRELFVNLVDEVHLWQLVKDKSGKITGWQLVDANPSALKAWGKSLDKVLGKSANEIFEIDAHSQFMPIIEKIFKTYEPHRWERYFAPTDQYLSMESIPFGDHFISTGKDITEQKKSEQALKDSELRLSLATQAGGVGVWDFDVLANNLIWDDQMFALYAVKRESFSSALDAWSNGIYEEDRERGLLELDLAIKGEKEFNTEFRIQHPNGDIRNIRALATVIRNESGEALRMIGTNWDITQERRALEQVEEARGQAEAASKAKSDFLANMSHEIRTPMNAIYGSLQLLKNETLSDKSLSFLNKAEYSCKNLLTIINDILDFSKIEARQLDIENIAFDLMSMVNTIASDAQNVAANTANKNIRFELENNISHSMWIGDPVRVNQIILNLVSNALKFTVEGSVKLSLSQQQQGSKDLLIITIVDTGIGMEQHTIDKLFSRFSQADSSTTRKYGGTGLGMSITQSLVHLMGGEISVESAVNKGTTVNVVLPLIKCSGNQGTNFRASDIELDLSDKHILIAEDNSINQDIIEAILEPFNAKLTIVANGEEAVESALADRPDLILMDIQMPIKDGVSACQEILAQTKDIPIVALTANVMPQDIDNYFKAGFAAHLGKPIEIAVLKEKLKTLLHIGN